MLDENIPLVFLSIIAAFMLDVVLLLVLFVAEQRDYAGVECRKIDFYADRSGRIGKVVDCVTREKNITK